jgi:hypothetical protein
MRRWGRRAGSISFRGERAMANTVPVASDVAAETFEDAVVFITLTASDIEDGGDIAPLHAERAAVTWHAVRDRSAVRPEAARAGAGRNRLCGGRLELRRRIEHLEPDILLRAGDEPRGDRAGRGRLGGSHVIDRARHGRVHGRATRFSTVANIPTEAGSEGFATNFDVATLAQQLSGNTDYFGIRYTGSVHVATGGSYTFYTNSDDGSALYVDGVMVVNEGRSPHADGLWG